MRNASRMLGAVLLGACATFAQAAEVDRRDPSRPPIDTAGVTPGPVEPNARRVPTYAESFAALPREPVFVSGRVVLEDFGAPPGPVLIERVCNGYAIPEGHTDSRGRFSIVLGWQLSAFSDAATPNVVRVASWGCELRAFLPGYRSEAIPLDLWRASTHPALGRMILRPRDDVVGRTVSPTSLEAPRRARKALRLARKATLRRDWQLARGLLLRAVALHPRYAIAWHELGQVHHHLGDHGLARAAYARAIASDPHLVQPHGGLCLLAWEERDWEKMAAASDRVLRLNPDDFPTAYYHHAVANLNLGNLAAAERSARRARQLARDDVRTRADELLDTIRSRAPD